MPDNQLSMKLEILQMHPGLSYTAAIIFAGRENLIGQNNGSKSVSKNIHYLKMLKPFVTNLIISNKLILEQGKELEIINNGAKKLVWVKYGKNGKVFICCVNGKKEEVKEIESVYII